MHTADTIRLTQLSPKGGCAAKWGPGELDSILTPLLPGANNKLLVGFETNDDAAIYLLNNDTAAVLTVDFLTPLVDDPYDFGRLAAANALSDVFAMGAVPHVALNVLALDCALGSDIAQEILRGGTDAVREAGAVLAGGHSIDDSEPKYGLVAFGTVHPDHIIRNNGAQPGDALYLTKPLGTGLLSAAYKIGSISAHDFQPAIASMQELNASGARAMAACRPHIHAATDVTGFGLIGHLHEMLFASNCAAVLDWAALPLFAGAWELSCAYCRPNRTFSIMDFAEPFVERGQLDNDEFDNRMAVICDPQTSGGLLVALTPTAAQTFEQVFRKESGRDAVRIGTVEAGQAGTLRFADAS